MAVDRTGGFAAAVSWRDSLLQDLVRVLYHGEQLPHRLAGSTGVVAADLFLDVPNLACVAADAGRLRLELAAWGPLGVTPPGGLPSTRTVLMRMTVLAPPRLTLSGSSLTFRLDGPGSVLTALDVDAVVGGPYPPPAQAILDSDEFRAGVQTLLQATLGGLERLAPALDLSFLGPVASAPGATVSFAVLDEAMAIGIDVQGAEGVTTHGNAGLLVDATAGNDVGMWTNPVALPLTLRDVHTKIVDAVEKQEATLDSLHFGLAEGSFRIEGTASKSGGSVSFSLHSAPHLVRPSYCEEWDEEYGEHFVMCTPTRHELWFDVTDVEVDVDRPWWAILLDILGALLTFGIGTMVVEAIVDMIRNNVGAGIEGSGGGTVAAAVQEFTFAGTSEPTFRLTIAQYECHPEGVFTGLMLRPQTLAPELLGPSAVGVEEALAATLRYRVRLPFDLQADDPLLSVRWTVRRKDTNEVLITRDLPAAVNTTIDVTGLPALLEAPELAIACRVYRTMGPVTTDLFTGQVALRITDRLDRSRPYVRWDHTCYAPVVRVEPDGTHTNLGLDLKERHSRIHRTAVPGRCRMVSRYSSSVSSVDDGSILPHLKYLDELPFPIEELPARRRSVCDYCFFGGPTRTDPLVP